MNPAHELTEEDIQRKLSGQFIAADRQFAGTRLAAYTQGAKLLVLQVIDQHDSGQFYALSLIKILADLHAETAEERKTKRIRVLEAVARKSEYRASVLELADTLTAEQLTGAVNLADEILQEAESAEIKLATRGRKKKASNPPKPRS